MGRGIAGYRGLVLTVEKGLPKLEHRILRFPVGGKSRSPAHQALTYDQLHRRSGLSINAIRAVRNRKGSDRDTLDRLFEALGLTLENDDYEPRERETLPPATPPRERERNDRLHNLPRPTSSFIGREKEIEAVKSWLGMTRLLTLTGSGGSGKTRLALQVAAEVLDNYQDGVFLVKLESVSEGSLVSQQIAATLEVREQSGRTFLDTLAGYLKGKTMLLVLDNCEHLVESCAVVAERLLSACDNLTLLATSREPLRVPGEQVWRIPPLSFPPPAKNYTQKSLSQYESVRLFIERAVAARPDFALTGQGAPSLATICQRLDGIPLAIELAAARARAVSVEEIEARLDDRFRLLSGGSRTALPRHQTIRALLDWSYGLLTEPERALLGRLSVFAGGWTLEAAEKICQGEGIDEREVLDTLTALVDKSLILFEEREGKARYHLRQSMREYAREKLLENEGTDGPKAVSERHRDYFLALAEEAEPQLEGGEQGHWLQRLEEEHENLRASMAWSLAEEAGSGEDLRLCGALHTFWVIRGHLSEGLEWCRHALEQARPQTIAVTLRAKALNGAANLAGALSDHAAARTYLEESLAIAREIGDRSGAAYSLNQLGNIAHRLGDFAAAHAYQEEGLAIHQEVGDQNGIAFSLNGLGNLANALGDYAAARAYYEESLAIRREMGNRIGMAYSLNYLGDLAEVQRNYALARTYLEESLAIRRETGDRSGIAHSLNQLGNIAYYQSDYAAARAYNEECLAIHRDTGNRSGIAYSLNQLGIIVGYQGNYVLTRASLDESLAIFREIGDQRGIASSLNYLGNLATALGDYAAARAYYEECLAICRAIGDRNGFAGSLYSLGFLAYHQGDYAAAQTYLEESLAIHRERESRRGVALSLNCLGNPVATLGNYVLARTYLEESLTIRREIGDRIGVVSALEAFANLAVQEDQSKQAVMLWGAATALREKLGAPLPPNERGRYDRAVTDVRSALDEDAFTSAWAEGRAMPLEQAIALALDGSAPLQFPRE